MAEEETVTIPKSQHVQLMKRDELLSDMEEAGVDNWQGMEEVIRIRNEREEAANAQ